MQTRLSRYILRQLVGSTLFVCFILIAVLGLVQSLKFLEVMIKAQASTRIFLKFFLLMVPDLIIHVLPIACFVAILFVYSRLMADREVIASYAAGFRVSDIAKPALGWGGFLSVLVLFLNVWILPGAYNQKRALESDLRNTAPAIFIQEGVFNSFGNVMLYVQEKESARHLKGIVAYMAQPNDEAFTIMAEEGELIYHEGNPNLLLYNGNRQEFEQESQKLSILFFDQTTVSLKPSEKIIAPHGRKIYEMNITELLNAAAAEQSQERRFYATIAERILIPLYSLTFSFFGVLFLLLTSFTRTFRLSAVLYSVAAVVGFESLTLLLLKLGSHSWIALGGACMLQSITIITSFYLLMRKR
jgi:lipopolysaccharide export system permease protein